MNCPFLPIPTREYTRHDILAFGKDRGEEFYLTALNRAQVLWCNGVPAKSLLLINRALGADLLGDEEVLKDWPMPYSAAVWVMQNRTEDQFIGNPRRHYQHLATRMVEPRKQQRSWRAWACWYCACIVFPDYPADEKQISEEGIVEPTKEEVLRNIADLGIVGEVAAWEKALDLAVDGMT